MAHLPSPLLVIEASTAAGVVALIRHGEASLERRVAMGASREDAMLPAIHDLLRDGGCDVQRLSAIACGSGPGSFTSLRIAAALAKGLCFATGARLYAIPSLLLAAAASGVRGELLVHSDAMRGERFIQHVSIDDAGNVSAVSPVERRSMDAIDSHLVSPTSLPRIAVLSSPTPDLEQVIVSPSASVADRVVGWWESGPVDLASWEPSYGRLAEAQVKWEASHQRELPQESQRGRES